MSKKSKNWNKKKPKSKALTTTTTKLKSVTPCHYGNVPVFKTPFPLYGAGWSRGFHMVKDSIVIDLADVILEPKVTFWNMEVPEELNDRYNPDCQIIRIQWVDGGVPILSPLFWHKLADFLEKQQKTVIVACMGGHGRTGTAIAILAGIYRLHGQADIGEWVRSRHCSQAIETHAQVDYIEEVLDEKTAIKPSWAHEMERWQTWKGFKDGSTTTYVDADCQFIMDCESGDCGNCKDYGLLDSDQTWLEEADENGKPLQATDQKIFGYFDKNDVYHTGYPPKDSGDVSIIVGEDRDGNDVFEYIFDAKSNDFLPSY